MRHYIVHKPTPRGITPRRLAASRRALLREQQRYPLFRDQVAAEQPTPEGRVTVIDLGTLEHWQRQRDLAATHWRWARKLLRMLDANTQAELLGYWNRSKRPGDAAHFADFIRTEFRNRHIPIPKEYLR